MFKAFFSEETVNSKKCLVSDDNISKLYTLCCGKILCKCNNVSFFHINIQSLNNKVDLLSIFLNEYPFDIICISEHWLYNTAIETINLPQYKLTTFFCREPDKHGGVAIFLKNEISFKIIDLSSFNVEFDIEMCGIELVKLKIVLITIYRTGKGNYKIFMLKFEELLYQIIQSYNKIIITGDINLELSNKHDTAETLNFLNLIKCYGFQKTISEPTRVTRTTSSCLDNFYTNIETEFKVGVIDPCLSDHKGQFFLYPGDVNDASTQPVLIRQFTQKNIQLFKNSLNMIDFTNIFFDCHLSAVQCGSYLIDNLAYLIDLHFPLKQCTKKVNCAPVNWYNSDLKKMREELHVLNICFTSTQNEYFLQLYKSKLKIYKKEIIESKTNAYNNFIKNSDNKSKASWNLINFERNQVRNHNTKSDLKPDDYNNYFTTVAINIINNISNSQFKAEDILMSTTQPSSCVFTLQPTDVVEVYDAIKSLNNSKCLDFYNISNNLLKQIIDYITEPLTALFNKCLNEGIYPEAFKKTKVFPLFKKGEISKAENYRPISIIPTISKVFEIIIKNRLVSYFDRNNLLNSQQFGFRAGHSTSQAVYNVLQNIISGLEAGKHMALTLCDLSKAFDCVNHALLLHKLEFYGITGPALSLIRSYLDNRVQCVSCDGATSNFRKIEYGVPQGSILGPFFFLIYVNDFSNYMDPITSVLFADDTSLITGDSNYENLLQANNCTIKKAENWFSANNLLLNKDKTQKIVFSNNRYFNNNVCVSILGMHLEPALNGSSHISYISKKLSGIIFLLRRLNSMIDKSTLRMVYFSLFHSVLSYGILLWGNSPNSIKIFRLQKKAVRILCNLSFRDHCKEAFISLEILSLPCLFIFQTLIDIHKNKDNLLKNGDVHTYNTRSVDLIRKPFLRLQKSINNTLNLDFYNVLPSRIKNLKFKAFKIAVKIFLLRNCFYSTEEYLKFNFNDFS